jgi:methionyl-tRNA formyltransferase
MTPTLKTIVFFGTDEFSAVSLRKLIENGFTISAVVTKPDNRKGRGRELVKPIVKQIAEANNIPVWQPLKVAEITENVQQLDNPIGVLVSYGKIIPQSVIDLFTPGIINVHPSLLPLYRGPSPIEAAILHGDSKTGVTIMQLSAAMDAGPLYTQITVPLDGTETTPALEQSLAELGAQQLCTALPGIINETIEPTPQNDAVATYCKLLKKEDSLLDVTSLTAEQAERRVRAYLAFPKTKVTVAGHLIIITKAHVSDNQETALDLVCADGRSLSIDELIGPSGKAMNAAAFVNGYLK